MPKPTKIHVLTIDTKHGPNTSFHDSYDELFAELVEHARGERDDLPGDDQEAVRVYFDTDPDDSYHTYEHTLPGIVVPLEVIDHVEAIEAYARVGEERDYEEQDEEGRETHILNDCNAVRDWLTSAQGVA